MKAVCLFTQLRANIDYGFSEANTTYGVIGVKVWVYKGDNFGEEVQAQEKTEREDRRSRRPAGERAAKPARRARKTAEKTEAAAADGEKAEKKPARRAKKAAPLLKTENKRCCNLIDANTARIKRAATMVSLPAGANVSFGPVWSEDARTRSSDGSPNRSSSSCHYSPY